jgi:dihydrofolate reductase
MREIIIIAAMAENRVIGRGNTMPWSIKGNLAHFKEMTMGWPCIMGRKTWESLPKKLLPGRLNIVVSSTLAVSSVPRSELCPQEQALSPVEIFNSISGAIDRCASHEKVFICGGESIYRQALSLADKIDLTLIKGRYEGDTFFPEIDNVCWKVVNSEDFNEYSIITYIKTGK